MQRRTLRPPAGPRRTTMPRDHAGLGLSTGPAPGSDGHAAESLSCLRRAISVATPDYMGTAPKLRLRAAACAAATRLARVRNRPDVSRVASHWLKMPMLHV